MMRLADNIPGKPHRWADAIGAWARGELVQWRYASTEATDADWRDCDYPSRGMPNWSYPGIEYRAALSSHHEDGGRADQHQRKHTMTRNKKLLPLLSEIIDAEFHRLYPGADNGNKHLFREGARWAWFVARAESMGAEATSGPDGSLIKELSKAKAVAPVATPAGDDSGGEYAMTFYFRNWDDLTDAHVAWVNRGDVVALGGEKGEAVAETENALRPDHPLAKGSCVHGESMAKHCAWCSARPVGKARMLTDLEITRCWEATFGYLELGIAIQHKFCEKNGIEVLS